MEYEYDKGDKVKAKEYYSKAAELGNSAAKEALKELKQEKRFPVPFFMMGDWQGRIGQQV